MSLGTAEFSELCNPMIVSKYHNLNEKVFKIILYLVTYSILVILPLVEMVRSSRHQDCPFILGPRIHPLSISYSLVDGSSGLF